MAIITEEEKKVVREERVVRHVPGPLLARDAALFSIMVALFGVFFDAAIGHGLTLGNDPFWSYWVTKIFLISAVFGLGTGWSGIGAARGAWITLAYTIILAVYYWSFSPVGLPYHPEWLDFEHAWLTGIPIHFGTIYLGYLTALWVWSRSRREVHQPIDASKTATDALTMGIFITVIAGIMGSLALGQFPGITWFLSRLLLTVPFLMFWWTMVGRDNYAAVAGGIFLGFMWAAYGHFVSPVGLPNMPMRIFSPEPPAAVVRWLSYREMWLIQLPLYLIAMISILFWDHRRYWRKNI